MGGLLAGILFSRSLAGFLGQWLGWREVFGLAALMTLGMTLRLVVLPRSPAALRPLSYAELLRSLAPLLAREPILQLHSLLGFFGFGAFSVFWTTLAFYLAARPEHFGGNAVGLFGLIAVAGATAAPISGRLSEQVSARWVNGASLTLMVLGFLLMLLADYSLFWLGVGVFLMDAGTQGNHISNQTRIYTLEPHLRSRVTSIYMVSSFVGAATGSALGALAWAQWHWAGVCVLGTTMAALALGILLIGSRETQTPNAS
jgi:predicted MFS family arabinose efflux permease